MGCSLLRFQGWLVCTTLMSKAYPLREIAVGHHHKDCSCNCSTCSDVQGNIESFFLTGIKSNVC